MFSPDLACQELPVGLPPSLCSGEWQATTIGIVSVRIYQHALDTLGVHPSETIFAGDGGSEEHRGARAIGLRTVLVTRMISNWRPDVITARRADAAWEVADVPAFVAALGL